MLHWLVLVLERPSNIKCYYFQLPFLVVWVPWPIDVENWIEKGRKNALIKKNPLNRL
jgi:hypothetical protein